MNRPIALAVALIIIVVAVALWLTYPAPAIAPVAQDQATTTASTTPPTATATSPQKPTKQPATKDTNTFTSIFTQPGSHECKYDQVTASSRNSNVIYIANGKMRGEFRTVAGGTSAGDLMVYNGGYLYVWKEGKSTGSKTRISSVSQLPHAIPTDLTSGAVMGTSGNNVSWDCHNWITDASLLAPPSYVTFTTAQ